MSLNFETRVTELAIHQNEVTIHQNEVNSPQTEDKLNINEVNVYNLLINHPLNKKPKILHGLKKLAKYFDKGGHLAIGLKIEKFFAKHGKIFNTIGITPQDWLLTTSSIRDEILNLSNTNLFKHYETSAIALSQLLHINVPLYVAIYIVHLSSLVFFWIF